MNWKEKQVLVTGAGGFLGSHLVEKLVKLGAKVRCFVRYNSRNHQGCIELLAPEIKGKIEVIFGDLRDQEAIARAMEDIDIVFHLGAVISIPYSYLHPREVTETNIMGTLNILAAAKDKKVEKIVHTSTSEVYGTAQHVPIDENHPQQAQSPYSASKIGADVIAQSFHRSFDLPIAVIRPFNTYGPRQSARAVIPTIITQVLTQKKIFLGAMHPTRDFTYVEDTIDGFIKIAESDKSVGEIINVGSDFEISIGDLCDKIVTLMGRDVEVVFDASRVRPPESEVERLIADNSKAKRLLGWEPKIPFDEGLKKTIDWISEFITLYKPTVYSF